jgi:hypothetical protein
MSDQQLQQQRRARRGCMFYGCIVGIVMMLMLLAGVLFGLHQLQKTVIGFTDSNPTAFPTVNLSPSQLDALRQRVNTFSNAVSTGKPATPLVLDSDEINALIADHAGRTNLAGNVYVSLQDDKVKGQISIRLSDLPVRVLKSRFKNRFLNGNAVLSVSLHQGNLGIFVDQVNVKGKPLPDSFMRPLHEINWAESASTNRNASSALSKIQAIEVKDGKLIVTPAEGPEKTQ